MCNKYKITREKLDFSGIVLHRIKALKDFGDVKKGDLGGWIEKESNLSQKGNCWVYDNAKVCIDALVCDNANVSGNAVVCGNASVCCDTVVCGNALVRGNAEIIGDAIIEKIGDYIVFQNWWSSGRFITYTKSNNMWKVGCFYGTGEQLIKKAYADNEEKGKMYEKIVNLVKE